MKKIKNLFGYFVRGFVLFLLRSDWVFYSFYNVLTDDERFIW